MEIVFTQAAPQRWACDALLLFAFAPDPQDPKAPEAPKTPGASGEAGRITPLPGLDALLSWLGQAKGRSDCTGEAGETGLLYTPESAPMPRIIVAGLGPREDLDVNALREAVALAVKRARYLKCSAIGLPLAALDGVLPLLGPGHDRAGLVEETALAAVLGLYRYTAFKTGAPAPTDPEQLMLFTSEPQTEADREALARALAVASGLVLARDLVNAPSNLATPSYLNGVSRELAKNYGFNITVLDAEGARGMGMGCYAAVAQGAGEKARFIILEHVPKGLEKERPLVFIGKGVTFDTGGISLKPPPKMHEMKADMGGAAAVLGLFKMFGVLGEAAPRRRLIGLLPCTDNMPDAKAVKPGDIVTALSGKTVEIINTDAEGRLLLCDALAYAGRFNPSLVVDIATLTGACVVALGPKVGAVFANTPGVPEAVRDLGLALGERFWPMPLWEFYLEDLKSDVADLKNVGPREGGAILGALFLREFAPPEAAWIHLDIAGPAWADKKTALTPAGGTGFGARLLFERARGGLGG